MVTKEQLTPPTVLRARRDERAVIARTLASAFAEDPVMRWGIGRARDPERRLRPLFAGFVRAAFAGHDPLVFVSEARDGAAIWKPPGAWKSTAGELVRMLPGNVRSSRWRFVKVLRSYLAVEKVHPEEPHYYLACLGTRADRQSKGVGGAVLAPILQRADAEGLPAYTESSNPRNVPFYVRHGFAIQGELALPGGCPPVTILWREPR